jgi:hypothetical protein
MAMRAHLFVEKVGRQLGLTETSWGENLPKPSSASLEEIDLPPIVEVMSPQG